MPDKHLRLTDEEYQVQWIRNWCLDADDFYRQHYDYKITKVGTKGLPNDPRYGGYSSGSQGVIMTMMLDPNDAGWVLQTFYETNGQIWTRQGINLLSSNPQDRQWRRWYKVGPFKITDIQSNLDQFVTKPEKHKNISLPYLTNGKLKDANETPESGMFQTSDQTTHLPPELTGASDKWGVILNFLENESTGAGYQIYAPIDGNKKGTLYMRIFKTKGDMTNSKWYGLNIPLLSTYTGQGGGAVPAGNYWELPTETLQAVDANLDSGYYKTTEQTTGMEGVPDGKKDGILKIIKDDTVSIQEYTPAYVGDNDYYTRTIPIAQTQSARQGISQFKKATGKYQEIHHEGANQNYKPIDYKTTFGNTVIYEYKFPSACNLTSKLDNDDTNLVLLKTMVATNEVQSKQGMIYQVAYAEHKEKVFMRKATDLSNNWGEWHQINQSGGGGTSPTVNLEHELAEIIKKWNK